ncbi:MAG: hypothetical protein ACRD6X_20030 [Pyrinomonadaceae bacterium]
MIGLAFALCLGFFLAMLTGGGHANFTWFVFFLLTSMFGLFYPAIGFLVADLRPIIAKSAFIAIFFVHIYLVSIFFSEGFIAANSSPRDFSFADQPVLFVISCLLFSAPQAACLAYFLFHLIKSRSIHSD